MEARPRPAGRRRLRRPGLRVGHRQLAHHLQGPRHRAGRPAEGLVPDGPAPEGRRRRPGRPPATSCPPGPRRPSTPRARRPSSSPTRRSSSAATTRATGKELWRLGRSSNITAPTPVFDKDLIVVMSGRRPNAPIFVAEGRARAATSRCPRARPAAGRSLWTREKAGLLHAHPAHLRRAPLRAEEPGHPDLLGPADRRADLRAAPARRRPAASAPRRSPPTASSTCRARTATSSWCGRARSSSSSATNPMGQPLMATPAIADGLLIVRGERDLFAVARGPAATRP